MKCFKKAQNSVTVHTVCYPFTETEWGTGKKHISMIHTQTHFFPKRDRGCL